MEGPERSQHPSTESLEADWHACRQAVEVARVAVQQAHMPLVGLDDRFSIARRRLHGARKNRRLNEEVAARNGLSRSPVTRSSLARFHSEEISAAEDIRRILAEAVEPCASFDLALQQLRVARIAERASLETLSRVQRLGESLRTAAERRRRELEAEIASEEEDRRRRAREIEVLRERETDWERDPHYDPRYDAWEIAMRRARRWV